MKLHYNIDLSLYIKREAMDNIFRHLVHSLLEDPHDYIKFYTDGSKYEDIVGASEYFNTTIKIIKFPDFCSIYTSEPMRSLMGTK